VLKSCHPSCKLNTRCRIDGHFGTMKMTGTKTGRRINERSLTLIRLKIFGGRIKFFYRGFVPFVFALSYHNHNNNNDHCHLSVEWLFPLVSFFCLLTFGTNIFYRNLPVNVH